MVAYQVWQWRGFNIGYQCQGDKGDALILVHGFGANCGHWRHNLPVLAQNYRCYAIDLIGFGASAKPQPGTEIDYTFDTWAQQVADFCREVVGTPAYLVGNSIGCIVTMQMAVSFPDLALGIVALNCSLRLLHERKRASLPWVRNVGSTVMQKVLQNKTIGNFFFAQIAKPKVIKNLLGQAYRRREAITDELVDLIYQPSQDEGASDVFLAFTGYSGGPLAEDLLPILPCPLIFLWGTEDPWEPMGEGRLLANYDSVKDFIPLEGLGHCPQDEAPDTVNPIILKSLQSLSVKC
ncbi:MAG: alpha/beta fold hydrolase [Cyanobacterium sp. T60_A2020_053]|nr:alpha/beta fold hydrolase [Cyanobacterium sp. T60_A2020_053]